jgi:hypothetical protein
VVFPLKAHYSPGRFGDRICLATGTASFGRATRRTLGLLFFQFQRRLIFKKIADPSGHIKNHWWEKVCMKQGMQSEEDLAKVFLGKRNADWHHFDVLLRIIITGLGSNILIQQEDEQVDSSFRERLSTAHGVEREIEKVFVRSFFSTMFCNNLNLYFSVRRGFSPIYLLNPATGVRCFKLTSAC